jgi:hypothetical protein
VFGGEIAALGYVHGTNKVKGYKTNSLYTTAFMGSAFGFLISKAAALKPMPRQYYVTDYLGQYV